jgi:hypothetical protein
LSFFLNLSLAWLVFTRRNETSSCFSSLLSFLLPARPLSSPRCSPPAPHNATSQLPISIKSMQSARSFRCTLAQCDLFLVLIFLYSFNLLCLGKSGGEKQVGAPFVCLDAPPSTGRRAAWNRGAGMVEPHKFGSDFLSIL